MSALRVLVVDDHESVRRGVCAIRSSRADVELCGETVDGRGAIAKAATLRPDIVIMDISMPGIDGISAAREIRKQHPEIATIILSMHDSKQLIDKARRIGIREYVTKGQAGSILLDALDSVAQGESYFPQ
jgi:two-component system, NarL family, response regulator NreC